MPRNLSHSGDAFFYVCKHGPGCREQGILMTELPHMPKVYELYADGYKMEMLDEPDLNLASQYLPGVVGALSAIWRSPREHPPFEWWKPFDAWRQEFPWIGEAPSFGTLWTSIHGDPTAANLMLRWNEVVLIDPLPWRDRYIPSQIEVDVGKVLQSALGWENLLQAGWGTCLQPTWEVYRVYEAFDDSMFGIDWAKAWYWCGVHCARIYKRAVREDIKEWAIEFSKRSIWTALWLTRNPLSDSATEKSAWSPGSDTSIGLDLQIPLSIKPRWNSTARSSSSLVR